MATSFQLVKSKDAEHHPDHVLRIGRDCIARLRLAAAVVDGPGDLALEIFAGNDAVDEAVLQQKFARLKALWQLHADRGLDRPRPGEADQRPRLGKTKIAK